MKLRHRAYLLGLVPAIVMAMILATYHGFARHAELEERLVQHGQDTVRHLAMASEFWVVSGNHQGLDRLLKQAMLDPQIVAVDVKDPTGQVLSHAMRPAQGHGPVPGPGHVMQFSAPVIVQSLDLGASMFFPEASGPRKNQVARVDLTLSREELSKLQSDMLLANLAILLVGAGIVGFLAHRLSRSTVQPLMEIAQATGKIAAGDFQQRLEVTASHELGDIQRGINQMSHALQAYQEDMEQRICQATNELSRQKELAESANLSKSRLLAAATHDLRQPMHAITLFVASMRNHAVQPEIVRLLEKVESATTMMGTMFSSILDVSKLEADMVEPHVEIISVREVLSRLHEDFEQQAFLKNLRLGLRAPDEMVASDRILLERVLRNLVSNAIRYTNSGGVLIGARRRGPSLRIQVWDTGIGIPGGEQAHIFDEYYQVDNPSRDRRNGLGLGLFIVQRLCRLLEHPLAMCSVAGKGTMFSVDVPLAARVETGQMPALPLDPTHLGSGRVLVVDNDEVVRDALAELMHAWGIDSVLTADSLETLAALDPVPDLVLADYQLNGESGIDLADAIRARYPDVPITIITGATSPESMKALRESGYHIMYKPVKPAKLRARLQQVLSKNRMGDPGEDDGQY